MDLHKIKYLLRSMFIISSDSFHFVNDIVNSWFLQRFCMDKYLNSTCLFPGILCPIQLKVSWMKD
jgi:hypothetical protein